MKYKNLLTIATVILATLSASQAAVVFTTGTTTISGSTNGLTDAHANASGTFSTTAGTGSAGVSFDLSVTASGTLGGQSGGLGVEGGSANAAIDNNGGSGPQEGIIMSISNVSGLAAGETLVITHVKLNYGANGSETYEIITLDTDFNYNSTGDTAFSSSPETIDIADTDWVWVKAGSTGDTKFTITSFTVDAIPEPSSTALLGLGLMSLALRRRR